MHFTINMRLLSQHDHMSNYVIENIEDAQQFATWLLEIGEGKRNQENKVSLLSSIPFVTINLKVNLCLP